MRTQTFALLKSLGLALLAVALVAIVTKLLSLILPLTPNILFAGAITLATIYGGLKAGILSLLTTVLTINYFFTAPLHALTLAADDLFRCAMLSVAVPVAFWLRQQDLAWRHRRTARKDGNLSGRF
jgi:K+-sensing histidine kinase KdpD